MSSYLPRSPVCSTNRSVWHLIKICTLWNADIRLLFLLPAQQLIVTELPACHKTWWLLFWDRSCLQGLDCKTSSSGVTVQSVVIEGSLGMQLLFSIFRGQYLKGKCICQWNASSTRSSHYLANTTSIWICIWTVPQIQKYNSFMQ